MLSIVSAVVNWSSHSLTTVPVCNLTNYNEPQITNWVTHVAQKLTSEILCSILPSYCFGNVSMNKDVPFEVN